jgi:hypothetical protein
VFRRRYIAVFTFAVLSAVGGCSGGQDQSETKDDNAGDQDDNAEGTDEPAWVNAMYLTCRWDSVESQTEVGVACSAASKDPQLDPSAAGITSQAWKVIASDGSTVSAEKRKEGDQNIFVLKARDVSSLGTQAVLTNGSYSKIFVDQFEGLLEGLEKGGKLEACFNAEIGVGDCFKVLGIEIPNADYIGSKTNIKPEDSACANKDTLPAGVPCEVTSDAMTGDYNQATEWFRDGNDLIAADGSLKTGDYCDAKGIKATSPKGTTSIQQRWYPYWKTGERPCFVKYTPAGSPEPWTGKYLVYNKAETKDGQPFCMFAIMAEPTIFGGRIHRLHIFKNPKVFPDTASGKDLTVEALQGFAEHFACQSKPATP